MLLRSLRADPGFPAILDEGGPDHLYNARDDEGETDLVMLMT